MFRQLTVKAPLPQRGELEQGSQGALDSVLRLVTDEREHAFANHRNTVGRNGCPVPGRNGSELTR